MDINGFRQFLRDNQKRNSILSEIMSGMSEEHWNNKYSGRYQSIHELHSRIFIKDYRWLNKVVALREYKGLNKDYFSKDYKFTELLFANISEYRTKREELDKIIVDISDELTEDDFKKY